MQMILQELRKFLHPLALTGGAIGAGLFVHYVIYKVAAVVAKRSSKTFNIALVKHSRRPMRIIFPVMMFFMVLPFLDLQASCVEYAQHTTSLLFIAAIAWLVAQLTNVLEEVAINFMTVYRKSVRNYRPGKKTVLRKDEIQWGMFLRLRQYAPKLISVDFSLLLPKLQIKKRESSYFSYILILAWFLFPKS
jgi:hypothetical protein